MILMILLAIFLFAITSLPQVFIQDDWYHLYQIQGKSLAEVIKFFNLWPNGQMDFYNFYRPLSTKLYFFLAYQFFDLKPPGYSLINIILFATNAFLLTKIIKQIDIKKNSPWTIFFYIFSIVHFTSFSFITIAEILITSIFVLLTILYWLKKRPYLSLLFFIISLTARENAIVIPLILFLSEWLIGKKQVVKNIYSLLGFFITLSIYLVSRTFFYGWPKMEAIFNIKVFDLNIINNFLKFLQWSFNLTGLIKQINISSLINLILFIMIIGISILAVKQMANKKNYLSILFFGFFWWLIFLLPVIFFPGHHDPWNLILPLAGLAVSFGQIFQIINRRLKIIFTTAYFGLFLLGLNFYRQNHWTVTRANLVSQTLEQVNGQCKNNQLFFQAISEAKLKELQYAWYYDLGPKVACQNPSIEVIYQLKNE